MKEFKNINYLPRGYAKTQFTKSATDKITTIFAYIFFKLYVKMQKIE